MRFRLVEEIIESFKEDDALLNGEGYIIDSEYEVRDLLINKPKAYRILYDANIDSYMICDANEHIHQELLQDAFKKHYYLKAEKDKSLSKIVREYIHDGNRYKTIEGYKELGVDGDEENGINSYLLYMQYIPKSVDEKDVINSPSSDGYEQKTEYESGTLWFRGYISDFFDTCGLLKIMR